MLHNLSTFSLFALALSSAVSSRPVANRSYGVPAPFTPRALVPVTLGGAQIGFNQQGGSFDDFFGNGNFNGNLNQVNIIQQQQQLVCSSNDLVRVRQQLAVVQEFAKQIILQQVCEVEIQTVIIQQINAQFGNFGRSVRRSNGRNGGPSFDVVVAQKITQITQVISQGGNIRDLDLGFLGSDIGRNSVQIGGSNWNDATSPGSVGGAYEAARKEQDREQNEQDQNQQQQNTTTAETETATATEAATASTSAATAEATAESSAEASATNTEASATESDAAATPAPTNARK